MNYELLKSVIAETIKANGNNEITGSLLQSVLLTAVNTLGGGYQFAGIASQATMPENSDAKLFYIAGGEGTYPNFNGLTVDKGELAVFFQPEGYSAWYKQTVNVVDIVNNLNSTATDKALSAAMGKQIGDNISQLGQKVDGLQEKSGKVVIVNVPTTAGAGISNNVIYPIYIKTGTVTITLDSGASAIIGNTALSFYKVVNGVKSYWDEIKAGKTKTLTVAQDIEGIAFYMGGSSVLASGTLSLEVRQYGELDNNIEEVKTIAKRKVEKLAWIGASTEGHTWAAGEKIFNTTKKKLAICATISPSLSFGPDYDPSTESVYIYEGNLYYYDESSQSMVPDNEAIANGLSQTNQSLELKIVILVDIWRDSGHYTNWGIGDKYFNTSENLIKEVTSVSPLTFKTALPSSSSLYVYNNSIYTWNSAKNALELTPNEIEYNGEILSSFGEVSRTYPVISGVGDQKLTEDTPYILKCKIKKGEWFDVERTVTNSALSVSCAIYAVIGSTFQALNKVNGHYTAPFDFNALGYYYANSQAANNGLLTLTIKKLSYPQLVEEVKGVGDVPYFGKKISSLNLFTNQFRCANTVLIEKKQTESGLDATNAAGLVVCNSKIFNFIESNGCEVYDLETLELLGKFDCPWNTPYQSHNNNAQPTPYYYDSSDIYPLFLVSRGDYYNDDPSVRAARQKFYFVRVVENEGNFTFTVVKEISYDGFTGAAYNCSFFADYETEELYAYSYPNGDWSVKENNPIVINVFALPKWDSANPITLTAGDVKRTIILKDHWIMQSGLYHDGKIFMQCMALWSWDGLTINGVPYNKGEHDNYTHFVFVIDSVSGYIETAIPIDGTIEQEGMCIYDGKLYMSAKLSTASVGNTCFKLETITFD